MPLFDYTASDRGGNLSHGQIEASDRQSASRQLAKDGLFVMGVTIASKPALPKEPQPPPEDPDEAFRARLEAQLIDSEKTIAVATVQKIRAVAQWQRSWSSMERALYLRQLQVMFDAGIPLYRSAAVLSESGDYSKMVKEKLAEVPLDLERGRMLSKSLERSGLFTPLIVSSVRLGEESGQLDSILAALADSEERGVGLRRALISRLTYPAVIMVAMSVGLLVLGHVMSRVMTSLPAFEKSASPMIALVTGIFRNAAFLPLLLLLLLLLLAGLRKVWTNRQLRLAVEAYILRLPIAGPLIKRLEANSVTGHLSLLLTAGLAIDRGLGLCSELVRTESFRQALLRSQTEVRAGEELAPSLKAARLFPEDVLALVQAGEVSGSMSASLDTAARYCADQVERTLESALAVIEPLLVGLMGLAIGAVLLLTFVPIFASLKDL